MKDFDFVPRERYYDRGFYELEKKHLWTKTWQMAARLDEIPYAGDYVEYEIVGNSILLVRQKDNSVKGFHNACRHRATELAKGCGRLPGGQLVCPFHGWRWNLDGEASYIFMEDTFSSATRQNRDLRLTEVKVEVWAGMVWINMDHDAQPLAEHLSPVKSILDDAGVGNMKVKWWKQTVINANWKMAQEAFFEAYHVMQTHPQILMGGGQEAGELFSRLVEYTAFKNGHARFQSDDAENEEYLETAEEAAAAREMFIETQRVIATGQDAMTLERDVQIIEALRNKSDADPTTSFADRATDAIYEYAEGAGIPMAERTPENVLLWGGDIFMYPNYLMLPNWGNSLAYRVRPHNDNPEWTLFDIWSLTTYPVGQEPERAELKGVFDKDDVENWGLIPRQDFSNIERQQRGLHSHTYEASRLSAVYEKSIANMHQHLDRYIAAGVAADAEAAVKESKKGNVGG
ncbi:aromatic ring-hydroxylating dioxygenase subunit alpha [Rhodococcus fascians]|nr:aromatic ring-hydroxylating dioxygenase subunit alpha [Rhodococcus fascians]MBY4140949.1 aromatic ring-hydroxylating dioxygenase subunit alpha [Rhodococcus fascians]MBY4219613.1 aromatic ring-hydroxylating dioxygenase subunit alpha [Rhodococcus fascians]MBY4221922.1 aromatic ring-hydroxylating dioxygenase subunit alpha [Rhodococcus fascians]MBY4233923.1 aromatic ring-hydroxylating dioxygenase subunit alpha [Rhodococcus fascians]